MSVEPGLPGEQSSAERQVPPHVPAPYSPPDYPPPPGPAMPGGAYSVPGQYTQGMAMQPSQQLIVPKNPALGVILSFFIPGLGSIVNGSVALGIVIMVCYFVSLLFSLILIGIPFAIGTWIWGMVDGYLSAQRWNRAHGIIS